MSLFKSFARAAAFGCALAAISLVPPELGATPALAQDAGQPAANAAAGSADIADPQAAIAKTNAYVTFLNRALRASESLQRYASWVDMKKGPTGKERIVYGLYSLYDVRGEISGVEEAATAEPKMPELDTAMLAYVDAYQKLAPVIDQADKYYERQDYKSDKMAGGKAFHRQIAALAPVYEAARKQADAALKAEKTKLDAAELAAIEKQKGKNALWHVRDVMIDAEALMDLMPDAAKPVVDLAAFKTAMDRYGAAVRDFDDYGLAHPNSYFVFESSPDKLLAELREFGDKLARAKGDARKGAGEDIEEIVDDYNMMVTTSQSATSFSKD